ncbi:MAG: TerD domain-containing protein [Succinimonas sp.]|jgi:stress response protein SCP2|nr:TerD domain-containing protein [Succinimonas sp.]
MAINLKKGQKIDLTKGNPGLSKLLIGLGWDTDRYSGGYDFDLDTAAFLLKADNKVSSNQDFVYYGNLRHSSGSAEHMGDSLTGGSGGDDEQIKVDLSRVPDVIERIAIAVTIYDAETRKQNFGQVSNAYIRIIDTAANTELLRYDLGEDFSFEASVIVGEIYRYKGEWKFNAVGSGFKGGLKSLCLNYGVNLEVKDRNREPVILKKGQKISLAKNNGLIVVENGWTAEDTDYDLKALVRYRDGRLIYVGAANEDECISTPEGAVKHSGDVTEPGELEHIYIKWHPDIASVAVSSYSAIENGTGSFHEYGVFVRIRNGRQIIEIPASDTSVDDLSYTLCFGEILFGKSEGSLDVAALEMYSAPGSENRIGYIDGRVVMDIGPEGTLKS